MSRPTAHNAAIKAALCAALLATPLATQSAAAGTLENMERERAILLETALSGDVTPQERHARMALSKTRLIDLERMVLRDKSLEGKNTPHVRAAFRNYDLTFLVHAAAENNRSPLDHWLSELGVSSQTILAARSGRR
jgi:hypothetical protein